MRKKPRISIIIQIGLVFLIAMSLSNGAVVLFGRQYLLKRAVKINLETAEGIANLVRYYLEPRLPFEEMSELHREQTHILFRELCTNFHYEYVYVYSPSVNGDIVSYVSAAQDEAMDKKIQIDRPFGTVRHRELYPDEKKILAGEKDVGYQFVDNNYGNVCMLMFPMKDQNGNVCAIIGIDADITDVRKGLVSERRSLMLMMLISFVLAAVLSLILLQRLVFLPIASLSKRMRRFLEDKDAGTTERNSLFSDEVTDIHESFDKMAADVVTYIGDLRELTAERAKAETQIEVARKIQRDIVPPDYSVIGNGCSVYCVEKPAKAVGGDFYDVFYLNDKDICIIIGDISGKGISAALFMVMVKTNLRNCVKTGDPLSEVLKNVNSEICSSNSQDMFATIFLSVLDTESGRLRYANAGHEKPLVLCEDPFYLEPDSGIALGLFEDARYKDEEIKLEDGQGILIYTDGVVESINQNREQYGKDRLKETAKRKDASKDGGYESEEVVKTIIDSVDRYSLDMEQFDDITCVAFVYGNEEKNRLILKPQLSSFDGVREKLLEVLGNTEKSRNMIMACEEMFSNIVNYSGTDFIGVVFRRVYNIFSVELIDNGVPFDPINAVIRNKDFLELDTGGMGIKLARLYSKEMIYNRRSERNHLILKFEIPE